ncbi:MAG: right-handed parallel beta-helix repeat-containing protein [Dehalococcoidia bacterium]|nr:right-handed parallel beta-helix repeat-containing protein [Dehalococcoidia bacterium]
MLTVPTLRVCLVTALMLLIGLPSVAVHPMPHEGEEPGLFEQQSGPGFGRQSGPTPVSGPKTAVPSGLSGTLTQNQTWSGDILVLRSGVAVASGVTLTIEPGTTVRFEHARRGPTAALAVQGVLNAVGASDRPIRFTSDALKPEHGDWGGIRLYPGSAGSVLDHVIIEYGGYGAYVEDNVTLSNSIVRWTTGAALPLYSTATITRNRIYQAGSSPIEVHYRAQPTITYNTLWGSGSVSGIRVEAYSHPIIRHNIIRDNKQSGISITWSSSATVEYNVITGNGIGVVVNQNGSAQNSVLRYNNIHDNLTADVSVGVSETLTATNNWWGTTNEAQVEARLQRDPGASIVYQPYEASPVDIGSVTYDFESSESYAHLPKTQYDTYEYIYAADDDTRVIRGAIRPPGTPDGIAWDSQFLYVPVAASPTDIIYKLDPSGSIAGSFSSPAIQTAGLTFDGQYLWVLDYAQGLVYQMDRSGQVIRSVPAPCAEPQGLAYDGQYLWTFTNQERGKAYQFDTSGKTVRVLQTNGYSGLAWDGKYLWINGAPGELTQIDPSNGRVIRAITSSGVVPQYLAWQEPYLWAAEWADEIPEHTRLIKMQPVRERITLDGVKDDWQGVSPLLQDPPGDAANGRADIKALYGFTDGGYLYLMLDFYELAGYDHFKIQVDTNGDGQEEYDVDGFFPGQPGRSVLIHDLGTGESKYVQEYIDFRGNEVGSNVNQVFELRFPLRFLQNRTSFYVRGLVIDQMNGQSYLEDATGWGYVNWNTSRIYLPLVTKSG